MCLPVPKRHHSHKHKSRPPGNAIELQDISQSSGIKPMSHGGKKKKKSRGHSRRGSSSNYKKHRSPTSRDKGPGGVVEEERGHPMRMLPSPQSRDRSSDEEGDEERGEEDINVEVMRFTMPARGDAAGSA